MSFLFQDNISDCKDAEIIRIPAGINTEDDLLNAYRPYLPDYMGSNWDALEECLKDFHWISKSEVILDHEDLPLASNEEELRIYLSILCDTQYRWKKETDIHLDFIVRFPHYVKSAVEKFTHGYTPNEWR